ncbi:MAG: ribosomal protein [Gammaproteobacteria bacterium]|jgi:large subunit ribosomal protein L3|nr:ribosomal protein [Gammaproteobacteria bacterium]
MPIGLVSKKCGMTRVFTEDGLSIPVTVLYVDSNRVAELKTKERHGYSALKVAAGNQLASRINKPAAGYYAKVGIEAARGLWEFRLKDNESCDFASGQELKADLFKIGQRVDLIGTSKGKGFAGTVKRHNFRTQDATHGNSLSHRVAGSVGMCQTPGRVFKGKKMAGQLGNVRSTHRNQEIILLDVEQNLIFVKGAAPGAKGGYVLICPSVKEGDINAS